MAGCLESFLSLARPSNVAKLQRIVSDVLKSILGDLIKIMDYYLHPAEMMLG